MKKRLVNIIFSILFMAILLMPMIFVDLEGGKISENENRVLVSRPPISMMRESPTEYIRHLNGWFSDNVGFRKELLGLYDQLNKIEKYAHYRRGLHTYLIGEDGHEYIDFDGAYISKYQGKQVLSDDELSRLATALNGINAYLDDKNIPMIVMFCSDKETIYPEYYPKTIIRGPEPVQLDIITEYLNTNTNIDTFNIIQRLLEEKKNYLVYNKAKGNLTHYNEIGGFFAYQELIGHINTYLHDIESLTIDDIDISFDEDGSPITTLKQGASYEMSDNIFLGELEQYTSIPWKNMEFVNENQELPNILVIRDSYITPEYMDPLPEHFSKTGLVHYEYMDHFIEFVDYYEPDIIVFESAERELIWFNLYITQYYENVLVDLGY